MGKVVDIKTKRKPKEAVLICACTTDGEQMSVVVKTTDNLDIVSVFCPLCGLELPVLNGEVGGELIGDPYPTDNPPKGAA